MDGLHLEIFGKNNKLKEKFHLHNSFDSHCYNLETWQVAQMVYVNIATIFQHRDDLCLKFLLYSQTSEVHI